MGEKRVLGLLLALLVCMTSMAQGISMKFKNESLPSVFKSLEKTTEYKFVFVYNDVGNYKVNGKVEKSSINEVMNFILDGKPLTYSIKGKIVHVTKKEGHQANSRGRLVSGIVTDETGEPLAGANVMIKGTGHGAVTDANGRYGITVSNPKSVLVYSFIGMNPYQTTAKNTTINVVLHAADNELSEVAVVSTGYQRLSRERSTAAYGFVDSTKLARNITTNLVSALEGQVSGLRMEINPYDGSMSPVLRGIGTFSNDVGTQPLIVIDDMPTTMSLNQINPYNIESITVLKDAAAASIYGALAANGIIVITTKEAKNNGVAVTVNADWFISTKPNFDNLSLASTSDIIDYQTDVYNDGVAQTGSGASFLSSFKTNYYNPLFQLYLDKENGKISDGDVASTLNEWRMNDYYEQYRENAWRTAVTQRYNVSLSQKIGRGSHFASFKFEDNKQRNIEDKSNSFSLYYKSKYALTNWLSATLGIDTRMSRANSPMNGYTQYNLQQRYEKIYNTDGSLYVSPYANVPGLANYNGDVVANYADNPLFKSFGFNVMNSLSEGITKTRRTNIRPFVNLEAKFLKYLKYNMMYQYEWSQAKAEEFDSEDSYMIRMLHNSMVDASGTCWLPEGGRYYQNESSGRRYTFRNQLNFDIDLNNSHAITAIAGMEFRETKTPKGINQVLYGYDPVTLTSERMNWDDFYAGVGNGMITGNSIKLSGPVTMLKETLHRYASLYANASYTFNRLYTVSGSIRWDEADLFGLDIKNQHTPLWSVGAGWNVTGEKFMEDVSWVNYLKLRSTYGINGNVDQTSTTFFVVTEKTNSNPIKTTYLNYDDDDLPNPKLRWEKTATFNVGIDFRLFNNVINGTIEYYNRHASDLLVRRYMEATLGLTSRVVNNGEMRNRGVEFSLTANILRKKDWGLSATLNYARNSNRMLRVDHAEGETASNFIKSPTNYFMEGTSYNTLWAYRIDRIENGYPIAVDKEGNDLVTFDENGKVSNIVLSSAMKGVDDIVNMGSLTPKYNGSLSLNARYKDFELNALLVYAGGNKLRLTTTSLSDNIGNETFSGIADHWTATNTTALRRYIDIPMENRTYAGTFSDWYQYGDINVKDGDYLKLRSINVSYSLPNSITRNAGLGRTKLTLQLNNLFTMCKAGHGIDPESYSFNSGSRAISQPKTVTIGVTTSF